MISASAASRALLARLIEGSDIVIDDVVTPEQVIASVAHRAPDLIVIDAESDAQTLTQVCGVLKANPGDRAAAAARHREIREAAPRRVRGGRR